MELAHRVEVVLPPLIVGKLVDGRLELLPHRVDLLLDALVPGEHGAVLHRGGGRGEGPAGRTRSALLRELPLHIAGMGGRIPGLL